MRNLAGKFCICALLATTVCTVLAAQEGARTEALLLDVDAMNFNRQTGLFEAKRPRIVQGNMRIEADESVATGDDFERSTEWRFKGHVKVTFEKTVLEANSAVFMFEHNQLSRADLEGSPSSFTTLEATQERQVRGGARKLEYDRAAGTLRLLEDAQLHKGQYEIQSCDLIYDFKGERWSSGPSDCGARIVAPEKPKPQAPPAAPPQ